MFETKWIFFVLIVINRHCNNNLNIHTTSIKKNIHKYNFLIKKKILESDSKFFNLESQLLPSEPTEYFKCGAPSALRTSAVWPVYGSSFFLV